MSPEVHTFLLRLDSATADAAKEALGARANHHFNVAKRASLEVDDLPHDRRRSASVKIQGELAKGRRLEELAERLTAEPIKIGGTQPTPRPAAEAPKVASIAVENPEDPGGTPGYVLSDGALDAVLGSEDEDDEDDAG